jgi:hypothetical protein
MAPMKCPARQETADDFEDSYSLTHLASRWGVSRRDIRQLLQQGQLPFVEVLGQLRVPIPAVRRYELTQR